VFCVPGIDCVGLKFGGACEKKSVIDQTAGVAKIGDRLDRFEIFRRRESYDRQAAIDVLQKEKHFLRRKRGSDWKPGHGRIDFRQRMDATCRFVFFLAVAKRLILAT
jgi:hypothetical protein